MLLAARPGIELQRLAELETPNGEDLWVTFIVDHVVFYVCVVYIPPKSSEETYMRGGLEK